MFNFTIPSKQNRQLVKIIDTTVEGFFNTFNRITNYAILKGAGVSNSRFIGTIEYSYWCQEITDDYTKHDDLYYGISPAQLTNDAYYKYAYPNDKKIGTRLIIDYDNILKYGKRIKKIKNDKNIPIDIFEFGNYPQSFATEKEEHILNILFQKGLLRKTRRSYSYNIGSVDSSFSIKQDQEYEYDNNRYVRVKRNNSGEIIREGKKLKDEYYWIKVEPIKWYVNHDNKLAVTMRTLIGGVPYDKTPSDEVAYTYLGRFIKEVFTKDFIQDISLTNIKNKTKISKDAIKVIKILRKHDREIDMKFGKTFDTEVKNEKKDKVGIKVKVIKKKIK